MAATPFKGTLYMQSARGGPPVNLRFSASDVANALVTFDDLGGISQLTVPSDSGGYIIKDIILSAAGVDTTQVQFRKGTQDTTVILRGALLANTTTDRTSRIGSEFALAPGATYFIKQLA